MKGLIRDESGNSVGTIDVPDNATPEEIDHAASQARVAAEAMKQGVPVDLALGVAGQESGHDINTQDSDKGAIGVMQLMPGTAARHNADPRVPSENIRGGVAELGRLFKKYDGDIDKVLAGYNAGDGAVDKYKGIPPYKETVDYVKRIKAAIAKGLTQPVSAEAAPAPLDAAAAAPPSQYDTQLTPPEEQAFQQWKQTYAPRDSGADYDLRGAFKAGLKPDPQTGHWPDTFKKPNHPTFSNESQYATGADAAHAGHWNGDTFVPPASTFADQAQQAGQRVAENTPTAAEQVAGAPTGRQLVATAVSTGAPIAGQLLGGPVGGAAAGALGEMGRAYIAGEPQNLRAILADAAAGAIAIPFMGPAKSVVGGVVKGAASGAITGAATVTARKLIRDGELPQTSDFLLSTGVGALIGGAAGGVTSSGEPTAPAPGEPAPPPVAPELSAEAMRERLLASTEGRAPRAEAMPFSRRDRAGLSSPPPIIERVTADAPPPPPAPPTEMAPIVSGSADTPPPPNRPFRLDDLPSDIYQQEFTPAFVQRLAERLKNAPDELATLQEGSQRQRLYHAIADEMEASGVAPETVAFFRNTIRSDAQKLNSLSQIRQAMKKMERDNPALAEAGRQLDNALPPDGWYSRFKRGYLAVKNVQRGSMTAQAGTTARNIVSQSARYGTEVLDQTVEALVPGSTGGMSRSHELMFSFARALRPRQSKQFGTFLDQVVAAHPGRGVEADLIRNRSMFELPAGVTLGSKYTKILNTFNTMQEQFFRRALFDGTLRGELRARGLDVADHLLNPGKIPDDIWQKSFDTAMEATFAATPKQGTLGRAVLESYQRLPFLAEIQPFPRFQANAYKFLLDHNPLGVQALRYNGPNGMRRWANVAARNKAIAAASTGTAFLASAFALRLSPCAGEKWYQVQVGDRTWDTRPFFPFSAYPFMAEAMLTMGHYGVDVIRDGKTLHEAMQARTGMTAKDFGLGLLAMNSVTGTALPLIDAFGQNVSAGQWGQVLRDYAASQIGGFTVPFRSIKDAVSGLDPNEAIMRDTRDSIFGKAMENIPGLSQYLPAEQSPIRAEPLRSETPWLRQTTGISLTTQNAIEKTFAQLHISPWEVGSHTGEHDIDRVLNGYIAKTANALFPNFLKKEKMRTGTDAEKTMLVNDFFGVVRKDAKARLKAQHPDMAKRLLRKELSNDADRVLTERGKLPPP